MIDRNKGTLTLDGVSNRKIRPIQLCVELSLTVALKQIWVFHDYLIFDFFNELA